MPPAYKPWNTGAKLRSKLVIPRPGASPGPGAGLGTNPGAEQAADFSDPARKVLSRMSWQPGSKWIIQGDRQTGKTRALLEFIYLNHFAPDAPVPAKGIQVIVVCLDNMSVQRLARMFQQTYLAGKPSPAPIFTPHAMGRLPFHVFESLAIYADEIYSFPEAAQDSIFFNPEFIGAVTSPPEVNLIELRRAMTLKLRAQIGQEYLGEIDRLQQSLYAANTKLSRRWGSRFLTCLRRVVKWT